MKIGVRITGGFVLVMLLTVAVAVTGWLGLRAYSNCVATSSLAQSIVRNIGHLQLKTDMFVHDGAPAAELIALKKETALLFSGQFEKMVGRASVMQVRSSVARYETTMDEYSSKQSVKTGLLARRQATVDRLVDVVYQVSDLQAAEFDASIQQLKDTAIDLKTAANILQFGLQFKDAISGLHDQTEKFIARRGADDRSVVLLKLSTMEAVVSAIALRLSSDNVLVWLRQASAQYRAIMTRSGVPNVQDLSAEADALQRAGNTLFGSFSSSMADAVGSLDDAREVAAAAVAARQIAQQIILVNQQTTMAESDFLRDGGDDAADRMLVATVRMQALIDLLTSKISDPVVQKSLGYLRLQIAEGNASFQTVVATQRTQALLVSRIHTSMNDMLTYAEGLNEEQLRRMADGRAQANWLIYGGTILALLIGVTLSYLIASSIIRPLSRIVAVMRRLAGGELVQDIPGGDRRDELREVAQAVTVFRDNAVAMNGLTQKLDRARLHQLADVSFEGILIHQSGTIVSVNEALCGMLGYSKSDVINHDIAEFMAPEHLGWVEQNQNPEPEQTITGEVELLDMQGNAIPAEIHARRIDYSGKPAIAVAVRDLTARRQAEATLVDLARRDPLTKLANRLLLNERLTQAIDVASRERTGLAVLCLDLDRFKAVNDQFGHAAGDELLLQVSQRLISLLRPTDTAARLGGDEFAVIVPIADLEQLSTALCERIIKNLSLPFTIMGKQVVIGASIGVALYPADGHDGLALLRNADMAMYRAKAEGRNTFRFYESLMEEQLKVRHALENDLRQAIKQNELELHYQPLVCCLSGEVVGFEALARWNHPHLGYVSPKDFIAVAEETGQIDQLGSWALRTACAEAATWEKKLQIAVNLSPVQFRQHDLPQQIGNVLADTGLSPDRLEIEVTEGVLIDHPDQALWLLSAIKRLGVKISLDDFGTGYSSLNYLQRFPFDKIKIDRSFIEDLGQSDESISIVRAIIVLGQSLKMVVIAEGVETRQQLDLLRAEHCSQLQGYLLGRPMSRQALSELVAVPNEEDIGQTGRMDGSDRMPALFSLTAGAGA